jgi:hypothetical protein
MAAHTTHQQPEQLAWAELIPQQEWALYREVLEAAAAGNVRFALGGGFAFSYYARRWRDTKDIDLYVLPSQREAMIRILQETGWKDCYDQKPYDRAWIYRGCREGVITDIIWAMANQRATTDPAWMQRARHVDIRGLSVAILPVEEFFWAKLYVLQRDRSDWPDLLNVLLVQGATMDWEHLLSRADDDARLVGGLLSVFAWMCPAQARELPEWLWGRVGLQRPASNNDCNLDSTRVRLLDTRDWFGPKNGEIARNQATFQQP